MLTAGGCVVALLALVLFSLNDAYQDGLARVSTQSTRPVVLNVALVNEDRGVGAGDDRVNLGRGYVTQIESDTSAAWNVLSRGIAEQGLAAGSYHLLVVIPGEFSERLLDLESVDPSPITVTYQVNGNGNARVEAVASQRGREIVSQLNGQLVDMYVASILGNLRQAQDGVRLVVDSEARHVRSFTDEVDPATRAFGSSLGVLAGSTDGSISANDTLVAGLDAFGLDQQSALQDAAEHDTSLADLVAARAEGALTYAAFMQALLAMDSRLLSQEVDVLARDLSSTGAALEQQLVEQPGAPNHAAAVAAMRAAVSEAAGSTAARVQALEELDDGTVLTDEYAGAVLRELGWDRESAVTLADLVGLGGGGEGTGLLAPPADFLAVLAEAVGEQISRLPYLDLDALSSAFDAGLFEHAGQDVAETVGGLQDDLAVLQGWDGFADAATVAVDPDAVVGADLDELADELEEARARIPRPAAPSVPSTPLEPAVPTIRGGPAAPSSSDGTDGPSIPSTPLEPAVPTIPGGPCGSSCPEEPDGPLSLAETEQAIDDLVVAAARYGSRVGQIADAYHRAAGLVALVDACSQTCGLHPGTDVTAAVDAVVWRSVVRQRDEEKAHLEQALGLTGTLEAAATTVSGTTDGLRSTSQELTTRISGQLDELTRMRESMGQVLDEERTAARSVVAADGRTELVVGEALRLTSSSERLADAALADAEEARRVTDLLTRLQVDVAGLLEDSAVLDERSARLTTALTGQVDVSTEFADSFGGVLPNAHSAGVLNERLMRFLVDPVSPGQRDSVAATDVTRPFPWVLITFTLSLTAAAVLAGRRPVARATTSVFARRDGAWLRTNVRALATAALVGAGLGAVLTWASVRSLEVPRESQVAWGAAIVLACLGLTLLTRWLIVQLRGVGVALCALVLVSYVFVSDAIGTGATSGLSRAAATINPLSRTESVLTRVLDAESFGVAVLAPLVAIALVGVVANLLVQDDVRRFVPRRWRAVPA